MSGIFWGNDGISQLKLFFGEFEDGLYILFLKFRSAVEEYDKGEFHFSEAEALHIRLALNNEKGLDSSDDFIGHRLG